MRGSSGRVVSVNVGRPRTVEWRGRRVRSAIWKAPVEGPVELAGTSVEGDRQADRRVHGGPDKAVYAYAVEDYRWWDAHLGRLEPLAPGTFGENLTVEGIDLVAARIGDRWRVGTAVLEVAQPRTPCFKLGIRMGDDSFPDAFAAAGRPGAYLRIVEAGAARPGDAVEVVPAAEPAVPVAALASAEPPPDVLALAAVDERVPAGWRRRAARLRPAEACRESPPRPTFGRTGGE